MARKGAESAAEPWRLARKVMELCASCGVCRAPGEQACAFFPELYRLWDREEATGSAASTSEYRHLVGLCTLCGLCPCSQVPADVLEARSHFAQEDGLPLRVRMLADVPGLARLCGTFPRVSERLRTHPALGACLRKAAGVHPERQLPAFPGTDFFQWARGRGLARRKAGGRQVAYFAGCTAGYLFPRIGQSLVEVLEHNGLAVWVPPQQCCGLPQLMEGDRTGMLRRAQANLESLREAIQGGDDLVGSCPSCGYYLKQLLKDRAYYSEAYQRSVGAGPDQLVVPNPRPGDPRPWVLKKSVYKHLRDDGGFSSLDSLARIEVAEHFLDAGEYLARLHAAGRLEAGFAPMPARMVYFAPCHQREQNIGQPYLDLLRLVPGLRVEPVGGALDCCGMGGHFGFKAGFHERSLQVGRPLMDRIRERDPEAILTDCMSCRLQFNHALPHPVFHPLEILAQACRG